MVAYTNTTPAESIAQKASVMADHLQVQQQQQQQHLELPPGFRFHPTDEEIITFYLVPKVLNPAFVATAIGEVDLNKNEPWELPKKAKMGEKEWYFYCQKDRKYPTGIRTNRATDAGYWKATGKDKEIFHPQPPSTLIGMKKTLVFYKGRAPRGEKTNWVMHEYRLEIGKQPASGTPADISNAAAINVSSKEEYVVCRIFHKSTGLKKVVMPSYAMPMSMGAEHHHHAFVDSGALPPLMDCGASSSQHAASLYHLQAGAPGSSMMGNMALPMINGHYFGNQHQMMAAPPQPPMPFYHQQQQMMQMQMGADPGFMVGVQPGSGPSSMVSQEEAVTGMSNNDQANGTPSMSGEISSVNMGMDGMWKY